MNVFVSEKVRVKTLPSGDGLHINKITITPKVSSGAVLPHVYIQSSIHGAELQGNLVIYNLLKALEKIELKAKITIIPLANPYATNQKMGTYTYGRFSPVSGDNWNRNFIHMFPDPNELNSFVEAHGHMSPSDIASAFKKHLHSELTQKLGEHPHRETRYLNLLLQGFAAEADCVLDFHTAPVGTRYIYAPEYTRDRVGDLNFPFHLIVPHEFAGAMDEASFMPWVALQTAMQKKNLSFPIPFEGYTLEFGSEEILDSGQAGEDCNMVLNFLQARGYIIDNRNFKTEKHQVYAKLNQFKTIYAPEGGVYEYMVEPGAFVRAGTVLCRCHNFQKIRSFEDLNKVTEIIAETDLYVINRILSASVSEGIELIQYITAISR